MQSILQNITTHSSNFWQSRRRKTDYCLCQNIRTQQGFCKYILLCAREFPVAFGFECSNVKFPAQAKNLKPFECHPWIKNLGPLRLSQSWKNCSLAFIWMIKWSNLRGARMVQWWEHSPPTNVAQVWFPDLVSYVGWICWFDHLYSGLRTPTQCPSEFGPRGTKSASGFSPPWHIWTPHIIAYLFNC